MRGSHSKSCTLRSFFFAVKPVLMTKSSQYGSKAEGVDGVVWKIEIGQFVVLS